MHWARNPLPNTACASGCVRMRMQVMSVLMHDCLPRHVLPDESTAEYVIEYFKQGMHEAAHAVHCTVCDELDMVSSSLLATSTCAQYNRGVAVGPALTHSHLSRLPDVVRTCAMCAPR